MQCRPPVVHLWQCLLPVQRTPRSKTTHQLHQLNSCTLLKCAWQLCRRVAMMAVVGILFTEAVGALLAPFVHTQVFRKTGIWSLPVLHM